MASSDYSKKIILNHREIRKNEILNNTINPVTEFEKDVIDFCYNWLKGIDTFKFKSSGSTGTPKTIEISKEQIIASIKNTAEALNLTKADSALVCLPASSTGGKMMLARSLYLDMEMECVEPSANPFKKLKTAPGFTALTPYQIENIIADNPKSLNQLKVILVGGAPVSDALVQKIKINVTTPVFATFGMTETVSHIALKLLNTDKASEYFNLLPNIKIKTTEDDCLQIKGDVTNNEWITTNDRVIIINDHQFKWLSRADFVINSGGVKIYPEEVESTIGDYISKFSYERYFIFGIPHEKLGQQCALFIEGPEMKTEELEKLKAELKSCLHPYHVPKKLFFIPSFKYTPSGKIDKRKTSELII